MQLFTTKVHKNHPKRFSGLRLNTRTFFPANVPKWRIEKVNKLHHLSMNVPWKKNTTKLQQLTYYTNMKFMVMVFVHGTICVHVHVHMCLRWTPGEVSASRGRSMGLPKGRGHNYFGINLTCMCEAIFPSWNNISINTWYENKPTRAGGCSRNSWLGGKDSTNQILMKIQPKWWLFWWLVAVAHFGLKILKAFCFRFVTGWHKGWLTLTNKHVEWLIDTSFTCG